MADRFVQSWHQNIKDAKLFHSQGGSSSEDGEKRNYKKML